MKKLALCALVLALCAGGARAEVQTWAVTPEEIPAELTDTAMAVVEEETEITLTFAGDCTLGSDLGSRSGGRTFGGVVGREGMAYPFANLRALFESDDFTIVNLEGVLSDSARGAVDKKFNFIGDPAYTEVLTSGGVEGVGLSNNHALDFGERGRQDTIAAVEGAGLRWFDETTALVLEKDGVRVGVTGSYFLPDRDAWLRQRDALREAGCAALIHVMHMGEEYADTLTPAQLSAAQFFAENGAALVVGGHPHVVQGMRVFGKTPVLFSLGNCVFGGNTAPRDYDACLLRATLRFREGAPTGMTLTVVPIRVSGTANRNDFQPVPLEGDGAQRVLEKMQKTGDPSLVFTWKDGGWQTEREE